MKINLSRSNTFTPEFNDNKSLPEEEQLRATFGPMSTLEVIDLQEILKQGGFQDHKQGDNFDADQVKIVVSQAGKYIPKYITLINAEGFTVDDIPQYVGLLPLAFELLFELVSKSSPSKDDIKNS